MNFIQIETGLRVCFVPPRLACIRRNTVLSVELYIQQVIMDCSVAGSGVGVGWAGVSHVDLRFGAAGSIKCLINTENSEPGAALPCLVVV